MEFPHTWLQTLGVVPTQDQPDSTVQLAEQPSPAVVLPSSQPSPPAFVPFPQSGDTEEEDPYPYARFIR
jgi:hypothetical protein